MGDVKLLSIGDVTYDTFMTPTESEAMCDIRERESFICFTYGDKIPVKNLEVSVGGNAANNAVGVTRLGIKTALVTTMGDDEIAETIKIKLNQEGVDLSYLTVQEKSTSNYSTVINYGGERTIFTFRPERIYTFSENLPSVEWAYLTSMAENFSEYYDKVVDWVKANNVKLAFNPGSRQIRAGREKIQNVLSETYIVYINRSEAESLTGMLDTHGKEKELLMATCQLGPKISIITDGGGGAYLFDGQRFYHSGVLPVDAYERTGAGDAFGAGCVSALIQGKSINDALLWGTVNSASVIGYIGSQKGLLRAQDLPQWLSRAQSCEVGVREI